MSNEEEFVQHLADQLRWASYLSAWVAGYRAGRAAEGTPPLETVIPMARRDYAAEREAMSVVRDAVD